MYIPLLRSKVGEAQAIGHLTAVAKSKIFPIIQLTATPPAGFYSRMAQALGQQRMGLDGMFHVGVAGVPTSYIDLFTALGILGVEVVPAVRHDAPVAYLNIVASLVGQYGPGLIVRTTVGQLPYVAAWVASHGWAASDIDLVIDVGEVGNHDVGQFSGYIAHVLTANIQPASWRSITLAASAAPRDLSGFAVGRTDVPRKDWQVWQIVSSQVPFDLDYGDYAQMHPDLTEPPGVAMVRAPISVRYAVDDDWVIIKGRPISGQNSIPMPNQYRSHATTLSALPSFGGIPNCWGDQRIIDIANGAPNTGNRASWVTILANRHLSWVADHV